MSDSYKIYASKDYVNSEIGKLSEGNVPSTDQPHMQLVTDANGQKVWEEKRPVVYYFESESIEEIPEEYRLPNMMNEASYDVLDRIFTELSTGQAIVYFGGSPVLNGYVYELGDDSVGFGYYMQVLHAYTIARVDGETDGDVLDFTRIEVDGTVRDVELKNPLLDIARISTGNSWFTMKGVESKEGYSMLSLSQGIRLYSSSGSGKQFDITVDDSGTLTATEVTD